MTAWRMGTVRWTREMKGLLVDDGTTFVIDGRLALHCMRWRLGGLMAY
jgi:hypothetical protein